MMVIVITIIEIIIIFLDIIVILSIAIISSNKLNIHTIPIFIDTITIICKVDGNGIDKYWNCMNIQFDDTGNSNTKNYNDIYKNNNYFNNCYYDNHHVFNNYDD